MITLHICLSITFELQVQEGGTQTEPCIEETGKPEWGDRMVENAEQSSREKRIMHKRRTGKPHSNPLSLLLRTKLHIEDESPQVRQEVSGE